MTESNDEQVAAILARGVARIRALDTARRTDSVENPARQDSDRLLVVTADDETRKEEVTQ